MQPWLLALTIALPAVAVIAALLLAGYFYILPKYLVKKLRSGEDNLTYPDDFDETLKKISVRRDLKYASVYPDHTYDLYSPNGGINKGFVLWVHGGFFIAGDKKGVENVCASIAASGFHVAAINYVTAPEYKYPAAVIQLNEAVKHMLSEHGELTKNGIFLAGDSAGGQIAAQYCALTSSPALQTDMKLTPCVDGSHMKGAVLVCAPVDVSELFNTHKTLNKLLPVFGRAYYGRGKWYKYEKYKSSKLYDYIGEAFPPCFITDGNRYSFEGQNKKLAALLDARGVPNETLFFDAETFGQVNHEYLFDLRTEPAPTALERLIGFLNQTVK